MKNIIRLIVFSLALVSLPALADPVSKAIVSKDGAGALKIPDYTNVHILAAATAETDTIPTAADGTTAPYVLFASTCDFRAAYAPPIRNGTFAADSVWTKGTGWTIGSGKATSDASQTGDSDLFQPFHAVTGRSYSITFTVSNYSAGNVTAVVGGTEGTDRGADGTFTETIVAGAKDYVALRADADFDGKVDDVSIAPVAVISGTDLTNGGASELNPLFRDVSGMATISVISADTCEVDMSYFTKP